MKGFLGAAVVAATLTFAGAMAVAPAAAAPATKGVSQNHDAREAAQSTEISARRRHRHWRRHHYRRHYYRPYYYRPYYRPYYYPRPYYYRPYRSYYGPRFYGPGLSFGFGFW
jgi:hypothetical protein